MRVLVTGANGFLGAPLLRCLRAKHDVIAASRRNPSIDGVAWRPVGDLRQPFDWSPVLTGVDAVVHLAGIAHMKADPQAFQAVNVDATRSLLESAQRAGISRFIFMSSILAQTGSAAPHTLTEADPAAPTSEYGKSKLRAEHEVRSAGIDFTIMRPVVVEGEKPKGNMKMLHAIAALPLPLPLGSITARRSTLSAENFCSAVLHALDTPATIGHTYIVADPRARSVAEMISEIRVRHGKKPGLFRVNEDLMRKIIVTIGGAGIWEKIASPLVVDPSALIRTGWQPR